MTTINFNQSPIKFGVPHLSWRQEQKDAFKKVATLNDNGGGNIVIEAPTGVGKSAIAAALGFVDNVTVLVSNHGLIDQYERIYNFKAIRGKPYYPCVLPFKVDQWMKTIGKSPTAGDCHFIEMNDCPVSHKCPYLLAKTEALQARRMVCTYKYAGLAEAVQNRPGILVMDEVHNSVEDMLDIAAFELTDAMRKEYKFDRFPLMGFGPNGKGDILEENNKETVIYWLVKQMKKISIVDLFEVMTPEGNKNKKMFDKLTEANNLLSGGSRLFYSCIIPGDSNDWRGSKFHQPKEMVMSIRLLDVQRTAYRIMGQKSTNVFMSATIGTPKPLMNELGVFDFEFESYPHPVPASKRPIYDLGMGKMTKPELDADPALYLKQANRIADFINTLDIDWRGIILTTSNYKINLLRRFLVENVSTRGRLQVYGDDLTLSQRITAFIDDPRPGRVCVDTIQGWGSGISLDGDIARFSIVAGVPFMNPSDTFEKLRADTETGRRYSWWKPFSDVCQATGRVSRGEHDDDGEYMLNVAAFADGSCITPTARSQYPLWIREAIIKWEP